jgi:hypothetical protein
MVRSDTLKEMKSQDQAKEKAELEKKVNDLQTKCQEKKEKEF